VHGALIDADLLARVYLAMTGGQAALSLSADRNDGIAREEQGAARRRRSDVQFVVIPANDEEQAAHEAMLDRMQAAGACLWRQKSATE
jgi:DNA polymerase-3 subunit epsilon